VMMPDLEVAKWKINSERAYIRGNFLFAHVEQLQATLKTKGFDDGKVREVIRRRLSEELPSLESFVKTGGYSAIIAARDETAAECYHWLRYTGRTTPEDFSMLSFDNNPVFSHLMFSTFDWGQDTLGYLAAHRFIGDIPVKMDANGNLTSQPRFIDRGSCAHPQSLRRS
jgi:DNA-binding LacI/PurR family transcriptional regulator